MEKCVDHLNFTKGICADCNLPVDKYGNTEEQLDYCSFPDCGCDGARLCSATEGASEDACIGNVENMWNSGSELKSRKAVFYTMSLLKRKE